MISAGKVKNIQALRGVAVLLVVLYHTMLHERKYGMGEWIMPDFFQIGASGVDLFFVISGLVITLVAQGQIHKTGTIMVFLWNRATRIYPLFWFYSILFILAFYIFPQAMVTTSIGKTTVILKSFLLLPQATFPILTVAWTLVHELYFYLVFALFMLISLKHLTKSLLIFLVFLVLGNWIYRWQSQGSNEWLQIIFHPLTLEFIAGGLIAQLIFKARIMRYGLISLIAGTLGLVFSSALLLNTSWDVPNDWSRVMVFGVPCVLIVYGAVACEMREKRKISRVLEIVGDASYSIYLSHALVLSAVGVIYSRFPAAIHGINALMIIIMLVSVLTWGFIGYRLVERPMLSATRKLRDFFITTRR